MLSKSMRNIPTSVGNTRTYAKQCAYRTEHPHVCGELSNSNPINLKELLTTRKACRTIITLSPSIYLCVIGKTKEIFRESNRQVI